MCVGGRVGFREGRREGRREWRMEGGRLSPGASSTKEGRTEPTHFSPQSRVRLKWLAFQAPIAIAFASASSAPLPRRKRTQRVRRRCA